ncbi:hypothetical protein EDD15DRAFT_2194836 [Pisolithus albus]|nr:hypothetical protein EDD15DRAFT_2194836 [Pisolithus albus]
MLEEANPPLYEGSEDDDGPATPPPPTPEPQTPVINAAPMDDDVAPPAPVLDMGGEKIRLLFGWKDSQKVCVMREYVVLGSNFLSSGAIFAPMTASKTSSSVASKILRISESLQDPYGLTFGGTQDVKRFHNEQSCEVDVVLGWDGMGLADYVTIPIWLDYI